VCQVGSGLGTFCHHQAWIPVSGHREIMQWDHAERKVHLENGYAAAKDTVPRFYWDFTMDFWK